MSSNWNRNLEAAYKRTCPNCNSEVNVYFESSRIISCNTCDTIFNCETNRKERAILGKNPKRKPGNPTFLEVGQEFIQKSTFKKGDRFKILAHIYVKSKYETFGAGKKYTGNWYYHEWFCVSQAGAYLSLVFDKEGYKTAVPIEVEKKLDPEQYSTLYFNTSKHRKKIDERSENEVIFFEGEAEDAYVPGHKFKSAVSGTVGVIYGVEWEDANLPDTYSYFEQKPEGERNLFSKIDTANDLSQYKKKLANFTFFRKSMLYTTIGVFVIWFISLFYSGFNVFKKEFNLAQLLDEEDVKMNTPIEITDLKSVYQLDLSVEMEEENTEVFAAVEILNENENVINLMQWDFWKAAGVDGGEKWSETSTGLTRYYAFPKQGKFFLAFHAEKTPLTRLKPNDKLIFEVNKGALLSRYFILLFLLFGVFTIVLYAKGPSNKIKSVFLR